MSDPNDRIHRASVAALDLAISEESGEGEMCSHSRKTRELLWTRSREVESLLAARANGCPLPGDTERLGPASEELAALALRIAAWAAT